MPTLKNPLAKKTKVEVMLPPRLCKRIEFCALSWEMTVSQAIATLLKDAMDDMSKSEWNDILDDVAQMDDDGLGESEDQDQESEEMDEEDLSLPSDLDKSYE